MTNSWLSKFTLLSRQSEDMQKVLKEEHFFTLLFNLGKIAMKILESKVSEHQVRFPILGLHTKLIQYGKGLLRLPLHLYMVMQKSLANE